MGATTPTYALPYPVGGDDVRDGDNSIRALAERVEALIVQRDAASALRMGRNVIRNGDFGIAQRGNGPFTAFGYDVDGVFIAGSQAAGSVTRTRVALTPGAQQSKYGYRIVVAGAAQATDYAYAGFPVEGVETLNGQVVTLSFTAYGAGKIALAARQNFGSGGSAITDTNLGVVTLTGSPTRYAVTGTLPTIVGKTIGTTDNLIVTLMVSAGASAPGIGQGIGIQNGTINVSDIQLEAGPTATPFERLPLALQTVWNQRYLIRKYYAAANCGICVGTAWAQNSYYGVLHFPTTMRIGPAVTASAAAHFSVWSNQVSATGSSFTFSGTSPDSVEWQMTTASGPGTGLGVWLRNGTAGAYIDLNAEL